MRMVFEEMSSWTSLTMYLGMKTTFETKYIESKYVRTFIMRIKDFESIIEENPYLKKYSSLQGRANKIGF